MTPPLIAVYGSGSPPEEDLVRAHALGRALAAAGYGVLNGGYGGTMAAGAEGAREVGGTVVCVTCRAFSGRDGANRWCGEIVQAATLIERIGVLVERAAGYVVLPGGNGTLAELSLAWEHQRKALLPSRPLVVWRDPWHDVLARLEATPYLNVGRSSIAWVDSVEHAVRGIRASVPLEG